MVIQNGNYDVALPMIIVYTTIVGVNVYTNSSAFLQYLFLNFYGGKLMADSKQKLDEAQQEAKAQLEAKTQEERTQASGAPDFKSDRDEVRQASEQLFRSLFRAGVHVAMAPVYALPEESREHFFTAGREFTRGLSTLAQEIADDFDKLVKRDEGETGE